MAKFEIYIAPSKYHPSQQQRRTYILQHGDHKNASCLECLLSFDAESVVFQAAIQKLKDQDI
jgi:hypothetical protein